jgi:Arc/MetJ family transcription regulator
MRTNIVIDDELIKKAIKRTNIKTKRMLVDYALRELVNRSERRGILKLKGRLHWEGDLEEMRGRRFHDIG